MAGSVIRWRVRRPRAAEIIGPIRPGLETVGTAPASRHRIVLVSRRHAANPASPDALAPTAGEREPLRRLHLIGRSSLSRNRLRVHGRYESVDLRWAGGRP